MFYHMICLYVYILPQGASKM